jgi:outer membrane murein-binding lipoprotein Lpp
MNEQDYQYLLSAYQRRSTELFIQTVAQEAKNNQLSTLVEALTNKVNELKEENEKVKKAKKSPRPTEDFQ